MQARYTDQYDRDLLKDLIGKGKVIVEFTKLDGTHRIMTCTSNLDLIPEEFHPRGDKAVRKSAPAADNEKFAFDLVKQGWRTITLDRVQSYETV